MQPRLASNSYLSCLSAEITMPSSENSFESKE
jgi:hypothetical protein